MKGKVGLVSTEGGLALVVPVDVGKRLRPGVWVESDAEAHLSRVARCWGEVSEYHPPRHAC